MTEAPGIPEMPASMAMPAFGNSYRLLELSFTRRATAPARWLPLSNEPTSDHLGLGVVLEPGDRRLVLRECTSSWLGAHWKRRGSERGPRRRPGPGPS